MIVTTLSKDKFYCCGVESVCVETSPDVNHEIDVLVVEERPLGVDMVLGMSSISVLGGVEVRSSDVRFCGDAARKRMSIEAPDFRVAFDERRKVWTMAWKWADGSEPEYLVNHVSQYGMGAEMRRAFDQELETWVEKGWLVPYDVEQHGPVRGLVPLMAVRQGSKEKVRPVLDFRELNAHVTAHTGDTDVCADQLRKWRR